MGKSGGHEKKKILTKGEERTKSLANKEFKATQRYRRQGQELLSQIGQGQFGAGGALNTPLMNQQLMNDFMPIQQESLRQFRQNVLPEIFGSFGRGNKGSSALNQALASAATNLQSNLSSQFAQLGLGERARQQEMQYNAANQLTQSGLPAAQIGLTKDKYAYVGQGPSAAQKVGAVALPAAGAIIGGLAGGGVPGAKIGATVGSAASQALLQ